MGRTVAAVEVLNPRAVRRDLSGPDGFAAAMAGRTFLGADRRGKYLWLALDDGRLASIDQIDLQHTGAALRDRRSVLSGSAAEIDTRSREQEVDRPARGLESPDRQTDARSGSAGPAGAALPRD